MSEQTSDNGQVCQGTRECFSLWYNSVNSFSRKFLLMQRMHCLPSVRIWNGAQKCGQFKKVRVSVESTEPELGATGSTPVHFQISIYIILKNVNYKELLFYFVFSLSLWSVQFELLRSMDVYHLSTFTFRI